MGNHATTAVNSDEDRDVESEDDTDIESDESSTSSHFGNRAREANNAMQGDDVGMLCDEVPDAEDLKEHLLCRNVAQTLYLMLLVIPKTVTPV